MPVAQGRSNKDKRSEKRELRRQEKLEEKKERNLTEGKLFLCPITFNGATGTMGKEITPELCRNKCKDPSVNYTSCHTRYHCTSPWRICVECASQRSFHGNDSVVVDTVTGLCKFHTEHGRDARCLTAPLASPDNHKPIPSPVKQKKVPLLNPSPPAVLASQPTQDRMLDIPLERVRPFANQPREYFDQEELKALATSIAEIGQQDPGKVRRLSNDPEHDWELIDGQRRWLACEIAGVTHYRAFECTVRDEDEQFLVSCVSNFCKAGHTELEEARAIARIHKSGRTYESIARLLGRSAFWINQRISLLRLDPKVQEMMHPSRKKEERLATPVALLLSRYPEHFQIETATYVVAHPMKTHNAIAYVVKCAKEQGLEKSGVRQRGLYHDFRVLSRFVERVAVDGKRFEGWDEDFLNRILRDRKDAHEGILLLKQKIQADIGMFKRLLARIEQGTCVKAARP